MVRIGRLLQGICVFAAALAAPAALTAQPDFRIPAIRATGPGEVAVAPDLQSPAEVVTLDQGVAPLLLSIPPDAEVRLGDWPIAPELRADVVLHRREIYAPDAKIYEVRGKRLVEVPRSNLVFYWGAAEVDEDVRVFLSVDPATGEVRGFSQSIDGIQELRPLPADGPQAQHMVASSEAFEAGDKALTGGETDGPRFTCGEEDLPQPLTKASAPSSLGSVSEKVLSSIHTAVIAVDTDNELMSLKFSNNTASATSYIANLIAKMNVFYERDLKIRLLQGHTILRPSTTADPYAQSGTGSADSAKLNEFSNYWNTNFDHIPRALSMILSGKQGSNYSASGIAWLSGLCSQTYGYSFSQVFKFAADTSTNDAGLVGHELGHNFGSNHTHCYNPPIDTCYNGQSGCYSGGTSCPASQTITNNSVSVTNVRGTIMSYCHLLGSCSATNVFHPRVISERIGPHIDGAVNSCIFPAVTNPSVAAIIPKSGPTSGGTPVVITGTNFLSGASVTIGGSPAAAVIVLSPTTITAVTPARSAGTVSVAVTTPAGAGSLSNSFFYSPPPTSSNFYTLTPCRVVDTRNAAAPRGGPVLGPSTVRTFPVTGVCGIPSSAKAISVNVTIVTPTAAGFLGIFPGNAIPLESSSMNFSAGQVRANNAVLRLATDGAGTIGVQNGSAGNTHFLLDVNGYFQ
ncbi:MAG TPA: M12 family metallo-peptidase [Thermoanaerobaculia bacterium]|nr:M12 family metallo-peptidase [Thermoanaerobaculia bacterium]